MNKSNFFFKLGGLIIVFATIYWRFLRPRAIGDINFTYTHVKFLMYCFSIFTLSITLFVILLLPLYIKYIEPALSVNANIFKKSYITKLQEKIIKFLVKTNELYNKMLNESFSLFYKKHFNNNQDAWARFTIFFRNYRKYMKNTLYIFYFLPPCIISFTYFIEVVIYHKFTYFPVVIFLMIFPISIRVIIYALRFHCDEVEKFFNLHVKVLQTNEDESKFYIWQEDSFILPENRTQELLFDIVSLKEQNLEDIELFQLYRESLYFFIARPYFNVFSLLCWLISLSTLLYLILCNKP